MTCGIYQIFNTVNGKSYIGQSRNIEKRWRQHTGGLDKPSALETGSYPLRAAFLKYGLKTVVSKAGNTGKFEFKIIEKCEEAKLLEREGYWIKTLNPKYNCNTWTPARKQKREKTEPKFWIQYHNYEKLDYLPCEQILDIYDQDDYEDINPLSSVSTNKRAILDAQGDTVFLIVGIGTNPKQYYLWSRLVVEEVQVTGEEGELSYDALGDGWLLDSPQLLNSESFNEFKKFCGNFGLGLTSINNSTYLETLKIISESHKPKTSKFNFLNYVEKFYTQVGCVNPKEVAGYTKRGLSRHIAVSLFPHDAAALLEGITTTLLVFEPSNHFINYKGSKILVHTLSFPSDPELAAIGNELLNDLGFDEQEFPIFAILGWVTVDKIIKYDQESFAADQEAHWQGNNLVKYQIDWGFEGCDVWGIVVKDPVLLSWPICEVFPPEEIQTDEFWLPQDSLHLEAFKSALETFVDL